MELEKLQNIFFSKLYISVHSPNSPTEECGERTVFVPVTEKNGTLVCDV